MAASSQLASFLQAFELGQTRLCTLATSFARTYKQLAAKSLDQFLATPINILPQGSETGRFLAIDVGGSNLRVGFVELLGKDHVPDNESNVGGAVVPGGQVEGKLVRATNVKSWAIEDHFKNDNEEQLFYWIGDCIAEVVRAQMDEGDLGTTDTVPVGITFSFPMIQASISDATLMPMGKGFKIRSTRGLDELLLAGYSRHVKSTERILSAQSSGPHPVGSNVSQANDVHRFSSQPSMAIPTTARLPAIKVIAIANDSVATMASLSYSLSASPNARVAVGLIVATGTNATTTMPINALHPSKTAPLRFAVDPSASTIIGPDQLRVVVNTEWGINGTLPPIDEVGLRTVWDIDLDANFTKPGFQPFEYMTSGRYLGELIRLILVSFMVDHLGVPLQDIPALMRTQNAVRTIFLSNVVARATSAEELLPQLKAAYPTEQGAQWQWTLPTAEAFLYIARAIVLRSARMNAAAVVGLLAASGNIELSSQRTNQSGSQHSSSGVNETRPQEELIIAHAGGVICQFPHYLELCSGAVQELVDMLAPDRKVTFRETRDGGLVGAAVLAGTVWNL